MTKWKDQFEEARRIVKDAVDACDPERDKPTGDCHADLLRMLVGLTLEHVCARSPEDRIVLEKDFDAGGGRAIETALTMCSVKAIAADATFCARHPDLATAARNVLNSSKEE